jgi:hypothetical protein
MQNTDTIPIQVIMAMHHLRPIITILIIQTLTATITLPTIMWNGMDPEVLGTAGQVGILKGASTKAEKVITAAATTAVGIMAEAIAEATADQRLPDSLCL